MGPVLARIILVIISIAIIHAYALFSIEIILDWVAGNNYDYERMAVLLYDRMIVSPVAVQIVKE